MDSLDRLRAGHKKLREKPLAHAVTEEDSELGARDRTLADILQNPKEHENFVKVFLFKQDPLRGREIADALADGHTLTDEQDKWLEKQRQAYNLRRLEGEQVREFLDEEDIDELARLNPQIRLIVGKIGAERAGKLLGTAFEELAVADDVAYRKMRNALRGLSENRKSDERKAVDQDFIDKLTRYGISEADYAEATEGGVNAQTKKISTKPRTNSLVCSRKLSTSRRVEHFHIAQAGLCT